MSWRTTQLACRTTPGPSSFLDGNVQTRCGRSSESRVDSLCTQFVQPQNGGLPPQLSTALALELATTMLRRALPASSPLADVVTQTLLHAVYKDYDPQKDLLDNCRFADADLPALDEDAAPEVDDDANACTKPTSAVDYGALAKLWNDLVAGDRGGDAGVACLVSCIQTLPDAHQRNIVERVAAELRPVAPDPCVERDETTLRIRADQENGDDDGDEEDDEVFFEQLVHDLREIYNLLDAYDPRAQRSARYKLHVLLSGTLGLPPDERGQPDARERMAQIVGDLDAETRARLLLL
ncbi:hypothetical protein, variant [Saprolegnia diclina VS20]|uniref:Uncharacterized protein n=1 Tax=Saprolegnia diclina (strain VS20) TaxID=1156394 RepID=T0RJY3_SAPDV|nr:hypothetical protein, variant [Saprolegnia diclina VS20]EQC32558.1 hypothetical protein, variant [Saprolegnia diclina VS20]|eukprot:XP_008614059.1 hypothetical protein, variant [Saprolegnia diclina VS20]